MLANFDFSSKTKHYRQFRPTEVRQLAKDFLGSFTQINVGSLDLCANHNIKQVIEVCEASEKQTQLRELLQKIYEQSDDNPGKILLFAQTKFVVDHIARFIQSFGVQCCSIHGDKSQTDRDNTLNAFRSGFVNILVVSQFGLFDLTYILTSSKFRKGF